MIYKDQIDQKLKDLQETTSTTLIMFHASFELEKHEVKKNRRKIMINRKTGNRFIGKSDQLARSENLLISRLVQSKMQQLQNTIDCDLWMIAIFETEKSVLMTKAGIRKKTSANLSNLYQLVEDCLQKNKISKRGKLISKGAGIINDDDQIRCHDWSRVVSGDTTKLHLYLIRYDEAQKAIGFT